MAGERLKNALKKYRVRYQKAARNERTQLLTEFCKMTGYNRKYAISLLNKKDEPVTLLPRRTRIVSYCDEALSVVEKIWEKAGYPFKIKAIDSDNGSEFINHHLVRYCEQHEIKFTRSRPYRKNDNAYIEQKNWTHVRRI